MSTTHGAVLGALLSLFVAGCAHSVTTAPPFHTTIDTTRLVPQGAAAGAPIVVKAAAVQIATWEGPGEIPNQGIAPTAIRVPEYGLANTEWFKSAAIEPTLVGTDIWPTFNLHTVPMLPYGSFWVEVGNQSSAPITIDPKRIELDAGKERMPAVTNGGAIRGRWNITVRSLFHVRVSNPSVGTSVTNLHVALPYLDKAVVVAPGSTWKGFVVFDIGNRFTADEYNELLRNAGTVKLVVNTGNETKTVSFLAATKPQPVVCLPGTKQPTYVRCEPLLDVEQHAPSDSDVRDTAAGR